MFHNTRQLISVLVLCIIFCVDNAQAAPGKVICSNNTSGEIRVKRRCTARETRIQFRTSLVGEQGPAGTNGTNGSNGSNGTNGSNGANGTNGADGTIRIYGDGSDGDVTLGTETYFPLRQYENITVTAGETLTVESGTVIRCTGTFTNNGTITVTPYTQGGVISFLNVGTLDIVQRYAHPGLSRGAAQNGEVNDGSFATTVSAGGVPVTAEVASSLLKTGPLAGGAGGGGIAADGGRGGGAVLILCQNGIVNNAPGTIQADGGDGSNGGGGGAGGLVVLASQGSITNAGIVRARGGAGGDAAFGAGPGGGGGGGIVNFVAPSISNTGTVSVAPGLGAAAQLAGTVGAVPRSAGGGGGAFGGAGGNSGLVGSDGSASAGSDGIAGEALQNLIDPNSLVM